MIRLSIQFRQALARLTLPVLFALTFAVMLIGKADTVIVDRARISLGDSLGPLFTALAVPLGHARAEVRDLAGLWSLGAENARLRAEVARLHQWQGVAIALEQENRELKRQLHWVGGPGARFVTARVVADGGGLYARGALLAVGPTHPVHKGEVVLDAAGLVGRISAVGSRTARVLLITDLDSRIPVLLEQSHSRAILVGTNGARPRLLYWSGAKPVEGERVVTTGEAGALPASLPVGTVHWNKAGVPQVVPAADLAQLGVVRVLDVQADAPAPAVAGG